MVPAKKIGFFLISGFISSPTNGIMVGHVFIGSKLPLFLFSEQHDLCDVLCRDLASG